MNHSGVPVPSRPVRRLLALSGALLIGTLGLGVSGAVAAPPSPIPPSAPAPLDGDLTPGEDAPGIADELSSEPVDVVVLLKDQPTSLSMAQESTRLQAQQELVDAWSQEHGLEVDRQFGFLVNGFSATVPGDRLAALSLEPEVRSVRRERVYERTEHTARELQGVPAAFEDHGVDGTGMVISIIDSGIDPGHHALRLDDCSAAAITHVNEAADAGFTCKVPDGYNYADENYVIKDSVVEAHGQHVSGIAAANGSEGDQPGDFLETGELDGVAPNAQLLAMKVFSNSGGGATDSDVVAAIEDSVKLDADVINMSLGASNGQKNASDASSLAIEAARDAGVVSVIAAGNDGQNFSAGGVADDLYGLHDDGTVGSPGTLGSALTVASIDNAALTQLMAYVNDQSEGIPYSPATGTHDGAPHRLVDLGLATAEETAGKDLAGDYALIGRGEISFAEKYENAIAADAGGVVLYNTTEEPFGMAGVETFTLPGITLTRSAGLELVAAVGEGETTLRITDEVDVRPSPGGLSPSSFTSWGATPTLDFEPEIAGIGGSVYSTYNDDTYGSNSGTSMASPNVAGMTALVLQHLEQTRPEVTGAERVDLAKVMLMNTAMIPTEEGATTPSASPRQVGAGLAQVDRALNSRVIATVDGEGAAALREIDGSAPFTVTLTSSADTDLEFTLPEVVLLAETFLGFAGDWNAEPIILPEGEELEGVGVQSELITSWGGSTLPLSSDYGQFWLSPNGDGDMDVLAPNLVPMRNASDIRYTVLDSAGDELKVLGQEQGLYRSLLGDWALYEDPRVLQWTGATFDGTIYDPQAVDYAALPDGRYTYRVETRLGPEQEWQSTDFDFGIDATPPGIEFGPYEAGLLSFEVVETGSGLLAPPTVTGAAGDEIPVTEAPDGSYTIQVDPGSVPFVTVSVLDAGFNLGAGTKVFEQSTMLIADATQLEQEVLGPQSLLVSDDALLLSGYVSSDIVAVRVGEETVETPEGRFRHLVPLDEGPQEIVAQGLDEQGEVVQEQSLTVTYDATAPELTVTEMATDAEGAAVLDEDGALTVRGTLTDERPGAELSLTSGQTAGEVAPDGSFEITVTPQEAAAAFTLTASDGVNTTSESFAISGRAQETGWAMPEIVNADCVFESATCFVPGDTADITPDGAVFTLRGEYPAGGSLTLTPGSRAGEDARYVDAEPISASIGEDGAFAVDLPVVTGENHFRMVIQDQDGQVRYDRGIRLHVDVTAPTLQVQEPTLVGGTLYTDSEQMTVAGTASDDGWGYGLSLNDSIIIERFDLGSPGEESNTRGFSTEITVAGGDTLLLEFYDSNGNVLLGLIPVVLDQDVPRLDIANLRDGERVGDEREIEVSATDENLAGLQVLLDGEVVHDQTTDLATQEHSVEDALFDLRELESGESEEDQEATDSAADRTPEVTATGARTRAVQDTLTASVATADLAEGSHTLTVVATDLAGGTTTRALDFQVAPSESEVGISGPAEVALSIHREELGDQSSLAEAVLSRYELTLDGEVDAAVEAGLSLRLAPGTVLVEGEQQVTLLAVDDAGDLLVDAAGDPLELTIAVSLTLERVTLTDGEVTATATFRSDDTLTASIAAAEGEGRVLVLANAHGSLDAVITAPGAEGDVVLRLLPDGSRIPVAASWSGGLLTFTGPSQGSYLILPAGATGGVDDGPGTGGGADAPGSGDAHRW